MRISDWSSDVCSSDLFPQFAAQIGSPTARYRGRFAVPDSRRRCPCRVSPVTNEKENRMHIKLFRALKAANLSDDAAAEVVEAIEIGRASCWERVCQFG